MKKKWEIVIINQHGENRGDESAKRGMLDGIAKRVGDCNFIMICQFRDRNLKIGFDHNVTILRMLIPIFELPGALLYSGLKLIGVDFRPLLGRNAAKIINAYEQADVVLSAPGGPYFGDLYRGFLSLHELAHWYMVGLAKVFKKPVLLYAPSAGPFEHRIMNILRRRFYGLIDLITTREDISLKYLKVLLPHRQVHLTADAAIQRPVKAGSREAFFGKRYKRFKDAFVVAVSANDYRYPLAGDAVEKKKKFERCLVQIMVHLHEKKRAHFLMFPQLYGAYHTDVDFLKKLGHRLPAGVSWELVDPSFNSDQQQELFGICDFCIASRYHPQIFAALQSLPLIAICYEHKQFGFMKVLDLKDYAFDIYRLDPKDIQQAIDRALVNHRDISETIKTNIPFLIRQSGLTSELVSNYLHNKIGC